VSIAALRSDYHWDDSLGRIWKWGDQASGFEMNGNVFFLEQSTADPGAGIPFTMGFGGTGFGELCIDNLQVSGTVTFPHDGLQLSKGAVLIYPK
jgi:hypothetical protein